MSDTITYSYASPSTLKRTSQEDKLFLAGYSEIQKKQHPCFFTGQLADPFTTARCLIALSNVVKSSFSMSPFEMALLKDPVVTAGDGKIRFEGFSHCAGVYARVDVLPGGHHGEFIDSGTTNVDFNQPMLSALSRIGRSEKVLLSIGQKEVAIESHGGKVVERKVPLPIKWIKGLTSVQSFLANAEPIHTFNRAQILRLFQSLPNAKPKADYYLVVRAGQPQFTPVPASQSLCIGGIHRLKLLEPLLSYATTLKVFAHPQMQSITWQLYFGPVKFGLTISRDAWRGFSGEGAALEDLLEDVPQSWVDVFDKYSYANQSFNPTLFAVEEGVDMNKLAGITSRLSAMGLLGYDLDENGFFYRQLPYNIKRILGLNPRLKDAEKLLEEQKVQIISQVDARIEARVEGSGVMHTIIIDGTKSQCTCAWYSRNQGERGSCKHVLAVKKKAGTS